MSVDMKVAFPLRPYSGAVHCTRDLNRKVPTLPCCLYNGPRLLVFSVGGNVKDTRPT